LTQTLWSTIPSTVWTANPPSTTVVSVTSFITVPTTIYTDPGYNPVVTETVWTTVPDPFYTAAPDPFYQPQAPVQDPFYTSVVPFPTYPTPYPFAK
jgi:hypothetical protein